MKTARVLALVCALTACGGSTESPAIEEDAGTADTARPETETMADSGTPETITVDTFTPSETATETSAPSGEAGKINCGPMLTCAAPQACCIGFAGGATYKCEAMCSGLSAAAKCDGPEDCTSGQRCCSGFPSGAQCKAACATNDQDMCHADTDCTSGRTCKECTTPGGGPPMKFCVVGGKCPF